MNQAREIKEGIYWIGVNDRRTHIFENYWPIPKGVAYNSYLIADEKVAVIDTIERSKMDDYVDNIQSVLGGRKVDYLIVNHMEPDHTGAIRTLLAHYPEAKIVGNAKTFPMLKNFYHVSDNLVEVKEGDLIDLGKHKLNFYMAPMLHWPETMVTFESTEGILFSGDIFGAFGTLDGGLFDDEVDLDYLEEEISRYYSNIVGKYGSAVQTALKKLACLQIKTICSTHGPVWENEVNRVIDIYDRLSRYEAEPGVVIAYGSMYGHTEQMAEVIARELAENGVKNIVMHHVSHDDPSFILQSIFRYQGLIIGSPTYSNRLYPEVEMLTSMIATRDIKNRVFGYFGSFSWAGAAVKHLAAFGESMKWETLPCCVEMKQGLTPEIKELCRALGREMAARINKA